MGSHHVRRLGLAGLGLGLGWNFCSSSGGGQRAEAVAASRLPTSRYPHAHCGMSIVDAVGNTPLLEIKSLSKATGRRIMAKAEYMNPGGSIKDRAALWLIRDAEKSGALKPGGIICEGTGGNTGIGLAMIANAMGYKSCFAMSGGIAKEKIEMMRTFGAQVILTPGVPFTSPEHYFHVAAKVAYEGNLQEPGSHFFTNQFENPASSLAHFESTAPEMWVQSGEKVDGFVCSSGTGGTIGGCARFLKLTNPSCQVYCIDPPGSGLHGLIEQGFEAAVMEGESPSSPDGRTAFAGDRVVRVCRNCWHYVTHSNISRQNVCVHALEL